MGHSAERGLVLLLPTGYAITGGTLAVLASFLLLAALPDAWLFRLAAAKLMLLPLPRVSALIPGLLGFCGMLSLLAAGFAGTSDPLANPLPLTIWTLWWVGFTLLQFLVGDLWRWFNPWIAPVALLRRLAGGRGAPFKLPEKLGYAPAIVLFFAFAWFELVYTAPEDPRRLAVAVSVYWLLSLGGILLFGYREWTRRGEIFSIFFRLVGDCAPLRRERDATSQRTHLVLGWPGQGFLARDPLPPSGVLFVLLTLSTSSFDGLSETFAWLGFIGVNPLEHPGRSAVTGASTLGLAAAFVVLATLYFSTVWLGLRGIPGYTGRGSGFRAASGRLVYSIVPIAVAFHIAHYTTLLLVNGQYALELYSDPFSRGWNLLGLRPDFHVTVSFLNNIHDVVWVWGFQTAVIVIGHVVGITVAHLIALDILRGTERPLFNATRSQVPLALLMVAYTGFGLWLLSTATVG